MASEPNLTNAFCCTTAGEPLNSTDFNTTSVEFSDQQIVPLWVPYVVLTVFLLGLVAISFTRFHRERQAQNQQRLEAIADQLEKDQQTAALLAAKRNGQASAEGDIGTVHPAASNLSYVVSPVTSPSSSYVPGYLDLFLSFSQTSPSHEKNGETNTTRLGQHPPRAESTDSGARMARMVAMAAAGKRLAKTMSSSKRSQPTRFFRFNDNGSMVDLRCENNARTFQSRRDDTLPEDTGLVVRNGQDNIGVRRGPRLQRQMETECWSSDTDMVRPPNAEQLLAPWDGGRNSFRMWSPTPSVELESTGRLANTAYETTLLNR